jgi:hypothetical protein
MRSRSAGLQQDVPAWIEVIRLGRYDWRVSDARLAGSDPARLLGYVEKLSNRRYEVVWMTDPIRWGYVDTFAIALRGFMFGSRFSGITAAERDGSVISRSHRATVRRVRRRVAATSVSGADVA